MQGTMHAWLKTNILLWARHWSTSTPRFLVEYVMVVRLILSLLKLVPNSIKYSTRFNRECQWCLKTRTPVHIVPLLLRTRGTAPYTCH